MQYRTGIYLYTVMFQFTIQVRHPESSSTQTEKQLKICGHDGVFSYGETLEPSTTFDDIDEWRRMWKTNPNLKVWHILSFKTHKFSNFFHRFFSRFHFLSFSILETYKNFSLSVAKLFFDFPIGVAEGRSFQSRLHAAKTQTIRDYV